MFVENLAIFFADFGVDASLAGSPARVIFDAAASQGQFFPSANAFAPSGVLGMASTQPMASIATADVPADPVGTTLAIGSSTYTVVAHEPDGTGISRLTLENLS